MSVSLNDKPNRVTVSGDTVTVTAGSGIQGPQGATGPTGAGGTVAFFGNFFSTETQTNASTTAKNTFTLNSTVDSSGVSIVDSTKITFGAGTDGTYDLQFSAQFDKTDSGTDEVDIWISKNGTDLEWSNTTLSLVGNNAKAVPAWNFQLNDVTAGDFFELHWWSPDSAMRVLATAAGTSPTRPAVPSLIVTVAQVLFAGRDEFVVSATAPADTTVLWADTTEPGDAVVPTGGTTGQVLAKASNSDYDTTWSTPSQGVTDATYVTLSTNGTLTNERVLTAGTGISITDGGAGSTVTVATTASPSWQVVASGKLANAAANIDIDNISTTWERFRLTIHGRSDSTASSATSITVRFNNDSTASYNWAQSGFSIAAGTFLAEGSTSAYGATEGRIGTIAASQTNTTGNGYFVADISNDGTRANWTGTSAITQSVALRMEGRQTAGGWNSTSKITQITLTPAAGSFVVGTTYVLEGCLV